MGPASSNSFQFHSAVGAVLATLAIAAGTPAKFGLLAADGPPSDSVTGQDRQFWSFQKVVRPAVPVVRGKSQVRTPVDAFVIARLESAGLELSRDAERTALIRRVSLDLLGL